MNKIILNQKKSLSTVVATILIVAISIVAIGTIYLVINNLIYGVAYSPEFSCKDIKITPPISIRSACYNPSTNEIEVSLKRNLNELKIYALEFLINSDEESSRYKCGDYGCTCTILNAGETKSYLFKTTQITNGKVSIIVNDCLIEEKIIDTCDV